MKKGFHLLILSVIVVVSACGGKTGNNQEGGLTVLQGTTDAKGNQRMQVSNAERTFTFKGKEYTSHVSRTPDESLPLVKNDQGDTFVDNTISLRLQRGGETVYSKTFTKSDFATLIGSDFLSKSILEGIVYNKTTPQGIVYAASVCYPQSDLFIPISITITADGHMSMVKDEQLEDVYETDSI